MCPHKNATRHLLAGKPARLSIFGFHSQSVIRGAPKPAPPMFYAVESWSEQPSGDAGPSIRGLSIVIGLS